MRVNHLEIQRDSRGAIHGFAYWSGLGAYYGYPPCCILNCLARTASADMRPVRYTGKDGNERVAYVSSMRPGEGLRGRALEPQRLAGNGTGFVPCPAHAAELALSGAPVGSLIAFRICPAPFPESTSNEAWWPTADAYLRRYGPRGRRRSTLKPAAWSLTSRRRA